MNDFTLKGKKAIVTGGSRGLGYAMAEALGTYGADLVIIGSSDKVKEATSKLKNQGINATGLQGDLSSTQSEITAIFNEALSHLGGVDILLNAAGIQRRHRSEEFPLSDWNDVLQVNLTSVFLLCQLAAREMIKQKKGKIINIASLLSFFGGITVPAYAASKGGIAQMTKAFSNEWAKYGINVNAIAPGYMDTDMNTALINDSSRNEEILRRIPQNRWGTPDDMKGIAVFLASSASDYVNGTVIPVDGGYTGR